MYRRYPASAPSSLHRYLTNLQKVGGLERAVGSSIVPNQSWTAPSSAVISYRSYTAMPTARRRCSLPSDSALLSSRFPSMHVSFSTEAAVDTSTDNSDNETKPVDEDPKYEGPRSIPTRHSRHHPPPIAKSLKEMETSTSAILNSIPGTLFEYTSNDVRLSKQGEYESGLNKSDILTQTIEYILRGHAARIPKTTSHARLEELGELDDIEEDEISAEDRLKVMLQLLKRIEDEGNVFVDLRSKYRCQLVMHNQSDTAANDGDDESGVVDTNEEASWRINQFKNTYGAEPGPSTAMYDIILDAIAVHMTQVSSTKDALHWVRTADDLRLRANARYTKDVQTNMEQFNVDDLSTPTALTFNAVIRAVANAPFTGTPEEDELRDAAIEAAFTTYDAMFHHRYLERNSATFRYIFEVVGKYFPANTTSRGSIAHAIYLACRDESVLDESVLTALLEKVAPIGSNHGYDFDKWIERSIRKKFDPNVQHYGFPQKFSKFKRMKRYDKRSSTY